MLPRLKVHGRFPRSCISYGLTQKTPPWIRRTHSDSQLTNLEKIIHDNIKATGPMSFSTYMKLCLSHPTEGYYMKASNPVLGAQGDFITSPEISQVLGELVAIWFLSQWRDTSLAAFRLIELGPGRGTLMEDLLRVISQFPESLSALKRVHLVETSRSLRSTQKEKILPLAEKWHFELVWHDSFDDVPIEPNLYTMLVAHEFFDALPVHVMQRTHEGWQEVLIASNLNSASTDSKLSASLNPTLIQPPSSPRLVRVLSPSQSAASTLLSLSSRRLWDLPIGSRVEISPTAFRVARRIGEMVAKNDTSSGGCGLVIDYGDDKAFGDSLRAFKNHRIVDVFHRPGECDLTANVDFANIKEAVENLAQTHGSISQAAFLNSMGLDVRVALLARNALTEERARDIENAAQRLVDPSGMGTQYRVMGITSGGVKGKKSVVWPFVDAKLHAGAPASSSS